MTIIPQFKLVPEQYRAGCERFLADFSQVAAGSAIRHQVYDKIEDIAAEWETFEHGAHMTFYQSLPWCRAWLDTVGKVHRVEPRIVAGRDPAGGLLFLLPLQIRRRHGTGILEWLTAPHATYGLGLYAPHFLDSAGGWLAENWPEIAGSIAGWDAVALADMPETFDGRKHPLHPLFTLAGANRGYRMELGRDYAQIAKAKQSGESRRQDRKRLAALTAHGEVAFTLPENREGLLAAIELMFAQQESRLAEKGIHGVFGPVERSFIVRLATLQSAAHPVLAPYVLSCGEEILAVMLCAQHGGNLWGLISSLAQGPLRRYSPGDLALRRCIEAGCATGLRHFDFAAGDTSYKLTWADEVMPLHELHGGRNLRGLASALVAAQRTAFKRMVKHNRLARGVFMGLRKTLRGKA